MGYQKANPKLNRGAFRSRGPIEDLQGTQPVFLFRSFSSIKYARWSQQPAKRNGNFLVVMIVGNLVVPKKEFLEFGAATSAYEVLCKIGQ